MTQKPYLDLAQSRSVIFLTAALVMVVTWAVSATGWTRGLNMIGFVGMGVILIGVMLARSALPGFLAHLFSLIIGLGWSFWVTSRLLPPHYSWLERWENLAFRLYYWYSQAMQGGTSYDNLMFILQMGVILWATGYLTIWLILRSGKAWQAIIPGGLMLLINLYYAPRDITVWFLVYLMISLVLLLRFNLLVQQSKWRAEGVFFRPDVSYDFLRDGLVFSVLVVILSWMAPPLVDAKQLHLFDEFQGSWQEMQGEWNRLFADLNYRNVKTVGTFGQSLSLGGPRQLTNDPVMDVQVDGIGRYWRAAVYDEYTGEGWRSTDTNDADFGPGIPLSQPIFEARTPVTQTYTFYRDNSTVLYTMGYPVSLDRSAKAHFNIVPDEQILQYGQTNWASHGDPLAEEITYLRSHAAVDRNETYQVVSAASEASVNQLRNAGVNYPAWVIDRYLQLPPTITERTRQLARDLTEEHTTPFDKAYAIEQYLRVAIEYNEKIEAPPPGVDKVDHILFTTQEAYCDYYASSMIVMLRSLGIPARMAAGFAQGQFKSDINAFHVINADAHSWVEVFFPRYGWINFEPTAAQPVIIRPTGDENTGSLAGGLPNLDSPGLDRPDRGENIPIDEESVLGGDIPFGVRLPWFGGSINVPLSGGNATTLVIGGGILALAAGLFFWNRQMSKPVDSIAVLYQQMIRLAGWMGVPQRPWQTPYEHAAALQRRLPAQQSNINAITGDYVRHTFSPHHAEPAETAEFGLIAAGNLAWSQLRPEMLKAAVSRRLPRWLKRGWAQTFNRKSE